MWKFLLIPLFAFVAVGSFSACSPEEPSSADTVEADTTNQINTSTTTSDPLTSNPSVRPFETITNEFNSHYKRALYYSTKGKSDETIAGLDKAEELWGEVMDAYLREQPASFAATEEWVAALQSVSASLKQAREKAEQNKYEETHELLEPIRGQLRAIRVENGIDLLRDHIIMVNDYMEEALSTAPAKDSSTLEALAIEIETLGTWTARQKDTQYLQRVSDLQRALEKAQAASGEEYVAHLQSFREVFVPFYLFYG